MGERTKTRILMDRIKARMTDLRIELDITEDEKKIDAILDELYDLDIEYGECRDYLIELDQIELDQIDGEYDW